MISPILPYCCTHHSHRAQRTASEVRARLAARSALPSACSAAGRLPLGRPAASPGGVNSGASTRSCNTPQVRLSVVVVSHDAVAHISTAVCNVCVVQHAWRRGPMHVAACQNMLPRAATDGALQSTLQGTDSGVIRTHCNSRHRVPRVY